MATSSASSPRRVRHHQFTVAWAIALLLLFPLHDGGSISERAVYEKAQQFFLRGYLEKSQEAAEQGYRRSNRSDPRLAASFHLLEAKAMVWRGMYEEALRILEPGSAGMIDENERVQWLTLEGVAHTKLQQFAAAEERLAEARSDCAITLEPACGEVQRAFGVLAIQRGDFAAARDFFFQSLNFGRSHGDHWLEATALLNLGAASLQQEHYDEAADWLRAANQAAIGLGAEDLAQRCLGNLGWAFFGLGDAERSLDFFLEAEKRAEELGDLEVQLNWLANSGFVYKAKDDPLRASQLYTRALALSRRIHSKEDIINSLEDLAQASIDAGKIDEANDYIRQLEPLVQAKESRLDALDVMFAKARITAVQHRFQDAESLFHVVQNDPASQTSMRMGAEHQLAELYEAEGRAADADRMYRTALTTFESARAQLKNEDSKLPFLANAAAIYDGYIHFLVAHGRAEEALRIADQSRAQTLAQGLGVDSNAKSLSDTAFRPSEIARKSGSTLLFYWLGKEQSYLWAINAKKTEMFPLPPQREIVRSIGRYRRTLLGFTDPVERSDADGIALYRMLVAPAAAMIQPNAKLVIVCDGELSQLNFETLIVPEPHPRYWIEDVAVVSAPSLHLLASANGAEAAGRKLLLFGDAVSPNADYPELPMAAAEMKQIEQNFDARDEAVYSREKATAAAYLGGNPKQFAYIHFVAHGVASRTDPLDSAIILSRSTGAEDSFKLHAREIIQHPIHARLVTVSACYGSGTRSYAGEGTVGLAWAFLRAGAHNVIGALWEVSDESTSQVMGSLYAGLDRGMTPSAALRQAKLSLVHSQKEFRKPFYWAPLQIYTGP